ncbi:MAG: hypothetical protein WCE48_02530 [Steroidobacteraceae bacterium]
MRKLLTSFSACVALTGLGIPVAAPAQDKPPENYLYATYFICDVTQQERSDEIVQQLYKPLWDAAVTDGKVAKWGWLAHHTGGHWRRLMYFSAPSVAALLDAEKKVFDQATAKNKKLDTEFGKICNSHDDYIWHTVAGSGPGVVRGGASFSTYFVCTQTREEEADALVKQVLGPMYDKMVADGKLKSWGWSEHVVGAEFRRLATFTATDVPTLMTARAEIVAALTKNPLGRTFDGICGSHADYIWEIKTEKP